MNFIEELKYHPVWAPLRDSSTQKLKGSFLEEVKALSVNYSSVKIEALKEKIRALAATGERTAIFANSLYDKNTMEWLRGEGFDITETGDNREGNYITVKW